MKQSPKVKLLLAFISFIILSSSADPFTLSQTFTEVNSLGISLDLSDDNSMLGAASFLGTNIYNRNISSDTFSLAETLLETGHTGEILDVTGDGNWLISVDSDGQTLVYEKNLGTFSLFQTI